VEGIEERRAHEVLGPDHARGLDQNPTAQAGEAKAGERGGKHEEGFKPRAKTEAVIPIGDNDGIHDIGRKGGDVGHHVNQDMLLDVEGPWVEGEFATTENAGRDPGAGGEDKGECLAERISDEKDDRGREPGCGIAESEVGVEAAPDKH